MASKNRSDGEGSVYYDQSRDRWVGVVVTGWRDGKPIRKKVSAKSQTAAKAKLRELRDKIQTGRLPSGRVPTVREWLTHWLEEIVPEKGRPSTVKTYRTYVTCYLIPLFGDIRLDKLTESTVQAGWRELATIGRPGIEDRKPLSATTVHQAHVIFARSLKVAMQRRHLSENVVSLMDAPAATSEPIEVLTKAQAQRVVETARGVRNAARWTVAFTLGLRQGEALALRWQDIDLDRGVLKVRHSLGRVTGEGLVLGPVKSKTGVRTIALPAPLVAELRAHRAAQNAERIAARNWWTDGDFVFTTREGKPIDLKEDWRTWKALLAKAKVPPVRLHAARHTAITMLLAIGVPPQVVKEIAGHARFSTTEVYVDKVDELHLDAADKMAAFWD